MKKCSKKNLLKRASSIFLTLTLALTTFFHMSMPVHAASSPVVFDFGTIDKTYSYSTSIGAGASYSTKYYGYYYSNTVSYTASQNGVLVYKDAFSKDDFILNDYSVTCSEGASAEYSSAYVYTADLYEGTGEFLLYDTEIVNGAGVYVEAGETLNLYLYCRVDFNDFSVVNNTDASSKFNIDLNVSVACPAITLEFIPETDEEAYQYGYEAGYVDGEASVDTDSFYNSGFESGVGSVDTDSYFTAGYQDGYSVGYSARYDEVSEYYESLLIGSEEYGPYSEYTDTDKQKRFYIFNQVSNTTLDFQFNFNDGYSSEVDGIENYVTSSKYPDANILRFYIRVGATPTVLDVKTSTTAAQYAVSVNDAYIIFKGKKYPCTVPIDMSLDILANQGTGESSQVLSTFECEGFYESPVGFGNDDISLDDFELQVEYTVTVLSNNTTLYTYEMTPTFKLYDLDLWYYGTSDLSVLDINRFSDEITNGYDASAGNAANDKLSGTLNEYNTAEDSLFSTVSSGLDDYEFYDMTAIPAVVTGMSFIGTLMTTWYNKAGGTSGIGIILSVLFTTVLVSTILGLSRFYQSSGHRQQRAEHTKALHEQNKLLRNKKGD